MPELHDITLPKNPQQSAATLGKDYFLFANEGTVAVPQWTVIGGQRSTDLSRSAESIDGSQKVNDGWGQGLQGLKSWSIDLDALALLGDRGFQMLEKAFDESMQLNILLFYADYTMQTGWASITDLSLSTAHDDVASTSATLEGNGKLSVRAEAADTLVADLLAELKRASNASVDVSVTPALITFSKASPAAAVFTLTGAATILSIQNGAATVNASNYTFAGSALTIPASYLDTLTNGTKNIKINTDGGSVDVVVIVTD